MTPGAVSLGDLMDPARARPPERLARPGRSRRAVAGETVMAALISAAVAVGMNWQIVRVLGKAVPGLGPDPFLQAWSLGWAAHTLRTPLTGDVFGGNIFYPTRDSLALTDPLIGLGPLALPLGEPQLAAAFGIVFIVSSALSALGAYVLTRQLGVHPVAAAVAAAAFAFPVWRLGQLSELGVLATGPMVLALAMLARGHGIRWRRLGHRSERPPARPLWIVLGWVAACWQVSLGVTHGLPIAYLLGGLLALAVVVVPLHAWFFQRGSPITGRVVLADAAGAAVLAATAWIVAVSQAQVADVFSAGPDMGSGWAGLIAPPDVRGTWSWFTHGASLREGLFGTTWGGTSGTAISLPLGAAPGPMSDPLLGSSLDGTARLLPGAVLVLLALAGLFVSAWRWRWRVALLGGVLVTGMLAVDGWEGFSPFGLVQEYAPGWEWARSPAPLIAFTTLALALLAAGFVDRFAGGAPRAAVQPAPSADSPVSGPRGRSRRAVAGLALGAVLPLVILAEGWGPVPMSTVPEVPRALQVATAPVAVLPSVDPNESRVMFLTALTGFPAVPNGQSWYIPDSLATMRQQLRGFPDVTSVAYLREHGVRSVVVLTGLGTDEWSTATRAPEPELGLKRAIYADSMLYQFR